MKYAAFDPRTPPDTKLTIPIGQYIAGYAIGIIHLEVWYPLLPGNVANATTYPFPVRYKLLAGGTQDRIHSADPSMVDLIVEAGRELEQEGVRAIVGACGYLGNFQKQVVSRLNVPVFLSSLLQVPMIHHSLKPGQRIGILCADGPALTQGLLESCGVTSDIPLAILGLEDRPAFSGITYSKGEFDFEQVQKEVVEGACQLAEENPDLGAVLLECSDMPPFAWAVQKAVKLPVFDFITMINWVHHGVVQRPYKGII
jgi:hypothetical protein